MRLTRLLIGLMAIVLAGAGRLPAAAEVNDELEGISVSPALVERQVKPGETLSFDLDVRNTKPEAKTLFFYGSNFSAGEDESGAPLFDDDPTSPSAASRWLAFNPTSLTIPTGQTQTIKVTITVPRDANPGGHYPSVIVSERSPALKEEEGAQIGVQQESVVLVLLTVAGQIKEEGKFLEIKPSQSVFWQTPVHLNVRFENSGNVHLKPAGIITINRGSTRVAVLDFNPKGSNTLPESIRSYDVEWTPDKLFGVLPAFGSYTVVPQLGFGNPLVFEEDLPTASFLLLPADLIKGVLIVAAIALFIFFGLFKAGQRHSRPRRRRRS